MIDPRGGAVLLLLLLAGAIALRGQTPQTLYGAHCAGCHGPRGEGARGPSLRSSAGKRAHDLEAVTAVLRTGVPGTEMPGTPASRIPDEPLRALAAYTLAFRTTGGGPSGGDGVSRGAALFRGRGQCLQCHRLAGEGKAFGPNLARVGLDRDRAWLRRALTDPGAEIYDGFGGYRWTIPLPDNFLLVEAVTQSGDAVRGGRVNEDAFSIQLRDEEGRLWSFLKSELKEVRKLWGKSPMPSYERQFTPAELDDLVAFLGSLRSAP